jgi:hypothetical protein
MSNYYLDLLLKRKHSTSETEKYKVIDCQKIVDKDVDTTKWIKLEEVIKKTRDLKILKGILLPNNSIVVKIGKSETIEREYKISQLLSQIPGFIIYLCYFSCNNNIEKIISNSSICAKEGDLGLAKLNQRVLEAMPPQDLLKILVMKEYLEGDIKHFDWDIKHFDWDKNNFIILLSLIKQIIASLYLAYEKIGFIHNDVHFGNFLIKKTKEETIKYSNLSQDIKLYGYKAIIMDFENSLFDNVKENYNFLYQSIEQIIFGIKWYLDINTNNLEPIKEYLSNHMKNNTKLDINILLSLIDKLEFVDRTLKNKILKYDPNIF